jgi:hypothetical protein
VRPLAANTSVHADVNLCSLENTGGGSRPPREFFEVERGVWGGVDPPGPPPQDLPQDPSMY